MANKAGRVALISAGLAAALCATSPLASAAPLAGGSGAGADTSPQRIGSTVRVPVGAHTTGTTAPSTELRLSVSLKPRDPAALTAFVDAVSTQGNPLYHHFLATGQFAEKFGPTRQTIAAVESALRQAGLKPGQVSENGLSIPITATAAQAAKAFDTGFRNVTLANGKHGYVATTAPALPADVASQVSAIVGLNKVSTYTSHIKVNHHNVAVGGTTRTAHAVTPHATGGPTLCSDIAQGLADNSWTDANNYYSPQSLASAYNMPHTATTGQGQTIAVFEMENVDTQSLAQYQACVGTSTPISYTKVDGGPTITPDNSKYGIESLLDIEDLIGLVPGASIRDYEAPEPQFATDTNMLDTYQRIVNDNAAQVISISWGQCETNLNPSDTSLLTAERNIFQQAAAQGQSVVAAAGDSGSSDCYSPATGNTDTRFAVDDPASQPYVTGVGGTHLHGLGSSLTETVWNDSNGAGGGGISGYWGAPAFQAGFSSSSKRSVPDVAALGSGLSGYPLVFTDLNSSDSTYQQEVAGIVGGTSGAAPTWAAAIAQINSTASCLGGRAGYLNPVLYQAAKTNYASAFRDITSGNNDIADSSGTYSAHTGYDSASGLGSPQESGLASMLCRQHDLLARDASGNLWQYQGTGQASSPYQPRTLVGPGWNAYNLLTLPVGHDSLGGGDMYARDASGVLWYYQGTGKAGTPFASRVRVGPGWGMYNSIVGVGSVGTGGGSLVARDASGVLWLYQATGNPASPLKVRVRVGSGWNTYNSLVGVGSIGSSSWSDLVARDASGVLWLYQGTGKWSAPFGPRIRISSGWNSYNSIVGARDITGDGVNDLVTRDTSGVLWLNPGTNNTSAPYGSPIRIGSGWNGYTLLAG
ncbi:protease pro-enzyme activation domain-containing protein [Streptacidiphilus jiangxiensis]|uniref:Pro-kumamolisin, activation domain n=1 Tax=Streptacidiphilus jiangxiensis TaxID=235985 RepID=A0A1H7IWE2_STRJI|nr:protease pro-enzyme activation domain-containing protein [Streptacidiphilus jiangxiensis]SEK66843.1 Pro-kumamolisin, activation domain [Streptacidiphilus jiangxiensis]